MFHTQRPPLFGMSLATAIGLIVVHRAVLAPLCGPNRHWTLNVKLLRIMTLGLALIVAFGLAAVLPRILIPTERGNWQGEEGMAAIYGRDRMGGIGGPMQRFPRTQITVVDVKPDPTGCDWGYPRAASGVVTIQTYTIFGLPWEKWIMDCDSEFVVR